jgi:type IV secretory pathway VirB3-like protein
MNVSKYSIWRGKGVFAWALALAMLMCTEVLYAYLRLSVSHKWSPSSLLLAMMLTLSFIVGVNKWSARSFEPDCLLV